MSPVQLGGTPRARHILGTALPDHAPRPSDRLQNCVVAVYGGGAGSDDVSVGQAAAFAYGCAGARVAVIDILAENAERTCQALQRNGVEAIALTADVTRDDSVRDATNAIVRAYGRIDVLHNNVGVPQIRPFSAFEKDDWVRGLELNCLGAATTIRRALPHLLAHQRGIVTNVSSVAAIRYTGMTYAIYSTAKAALNQLTVSVALEYGSRGLRANAILPGLLSTGMGRSLARGALDTPTRADRCPMKMEGDAWDVANAAVYLASSEARYINGHLLVVDGGLSAAC